MSKFVRPTTHVGVVGYFFNQLSGDSGSGAVLGDFKSRVNGIGLQAGHFFVIDKRKYYVNVKAISEFDAQNRASGWNFWIAVSIPLGAGK